MAILQSHYQEAIAQHKLQPDPAQESAVQELDTLLSALIKQKNKRFTLLKKRSPQKGLYLHGPVGRGKTMLMDLFMRELQDAQIRGERWHFHAFMLEIHRSLHDLVLSAEQVETRVQRLADTWADGIDVLCFDEFHVTDVADAMIMMPLFTRFFERGLVVVSTSNWAPDNLYAGGLQRARFLPFIAVIKQHMQIVDVSGTIDYRMLKAQCSASWLHPLNQDTAEEFDTLFRDAAGYDPIETHEIHIGDKAKGRTWVIPRASKSVAWLDLSQILSQPLGAADFLALAKRYQLLFLDNLQPFTSEGSERTKRFMVMIDALYDAGVKLKIRGDTLPKALYPATGHLGFEFNRILSRLHEMTSEQP